MKPVELVLSKLTRVNRGSKGWQACCPAHDDSSPSLSISEGDDGRALIYCHAGCTLEKICDALDINQSQLFVKPKLKPLVLKKRQSEADDIELDERFQALSDADKHEAMYAPQLAILPSFPNAALPRVLQQFVEAEAHATQTPTDLVALPALATLSATIARKVEVQPREGWNEPVNLYVAAILEPGSRKSQVLKDVTQALRDVEAELIEEAKSTVARKQSARRQAEATLKKLEKRAVDKNDAAAKRKAEDLAAELAKQPESHLPRLIVDDITPERLEVVLAQQGGRIASLSAEGGVFDLMAGRYSNGAPQFEVYLKGHSGDELNTDRMSRNGVRVTRPAITCAYTIQPSVLRELSKNSVFRGRGLFARFLYAIPENRLGTRVIAADPVPPAIRKEYDQLVRRLAHFDGQVLLKLTAKASKKLQAFEGEIEAMLADNGQLEEIRDWGAKLAGATVRIAAVLHCVEHGPEGAIKEATMSAAVRIAKYLVPHAYAVLTNQRMEDSDAQYLLRWIKRHNLSEFTKRDAHQQCKRRFQRAADLDDALEELEQRKCIVRQPDEPKGPGRPPSPAYIVNARLYGVKRE